MLLNVHQFIIHNIKIEDSTKKLDLCDKYHKVSDTSINIISEIFNAYDKNIGKSYGTFNSADFKQILEEYTLGEHKDLLTSSKKMMNILKQKIPNTAKNENVLFSRIQRITLKPSHIVKDYLFIVMLRNRDGAMIDNYTFKDSSYISAKDIRFAGRIDITEWKKAIETGQNSDFQYISFLNAADYFKSFLGCEDAREPKKTTALLTKLILKFANNLGLDPMATSELRQKVLIYLKPFAESGIPFDATSFANYISPNNPNQIAELMNSDEFLIPDNFILNLNELDNLGRIKVKTENWNLDLDIDAILNKQFIYDKTNNIVIIKEPPVDLVNSITKIEENEDISEIS